MKCQNCGETLKDDAKVCFSCGQSTDNNDIEQLIDTMIKEDEAANMTSKPKKTSKPNKSKTEVKADAKTGRKTKAKFKVLGKSKTEAIGKTKTEAVVFGKGVDITRYVTLAIVVLFLITMLFNWFSLGGRGAFAGFILDGANSSRYMSDRVVDMSQAQINALVAEEEILKFSPNKLVDYMKAYQGEYTSLDTASGQQRLSIAGWVHVIYVKGFYLVFIAALLAILMLALDKGLRTIEWTRGFSVLAIVIIGLNYMALKIPFFSVFALKTRNLLRLENPLTSVTMNMNGMNVNNEFYPYKLIENNGFFIAVVACVLWFILGTVLVEMKKDKEFK